MLLTATKPLSPIENYILIISDISVIVAVWWKTQRKITKYKFSGSYPIAWHLDVHPNACGNEKLSIHKHFLKKPTLFCFFLLSLRHITNSYNNNDEEKVIFRHGQRPCRF